MTAAYRMLVRMQATRGRLLAIGGLGLLVVFVGLANRGDDPEAVFDMLHGAGLALFVPITALVLASAVLGEMAEDGTLLYVWARPMPRRALTLAAMGASLTVALPCVLVPMMLAALALQADAELLVGTIVATTLSTVTYTAIFVGFGARVPRALLWGLVYVALWEGIVSGVSAGVARTSLSLYSNSLLRAIADADKLKFGVGGGVAVAVLVGVAALGVAFTTWILHRIDVP